jgi:hypothetical protein
MWPREKKLEKSSSNILIRNGNQDTVPHATRKKILETGFPGIRVDTRVDFFYFAKFEINTKLKFISRNFVTIEFAWEFFVTNLT